MTCSALDRLTAYRLVEDGIFSYADLGYPMIDGGMMTYATVQEHLTIRNLYGEAKEEKARMDGLR